MLEENYDSIPDLGEYTPKVFSWDTQIIHMVPIPPDGELGTPGPGLGITFLNVRAGRAEMAKMVRLEKVKWLRLCGQGWWRWPRYWEYL